jgi:ferredoxin-NADP reductase
MIKYAPTKVYLCGSPAFEEDVHELLKSVGVSKRNIVHV